MLIATINDNIKSFLGIGQNYIRTGNKQSETTLKSLDGASVISESDLLVKFLSVVSL